jgi:hypothetical protein
MHLAREASRTFGVNSRRKLIAGCFRSKTDARPQLLLGNNMQEKSSIGSGFDYLQSATYQSEVWAPPLLASFSCTATPMN